MDLRLPDYVDGAKDGKIHIRDILPKEKDRRS